MGTLIKSATIIDERSALNGKVRDLLIEKGIITSVSTNIQRGRHKVVSEKGLYVSPGWIDMRANFRDPGFEYKEDLTSGTKAAAHGGFTRVVIMPSGMPVTDGKQVVEYLYSKSKGLPVSVLPAGSLSYGMEGRKLSEMFDMHQAGAIAFTDDKKQVDTELMARALEYSRNFGGLILSFPYDRGVSPAGLLNEGSTSASTGMPGIPDLSEEMRLQRDIELLRYCGGRLHVSLISTAASVELIRKAKKTGLNITCGIAAHQLSFTDADLVSFDNNLKVLPPFRTAKDHKSIITGLKDGTIDCICSDHTPEDVEHKNLEFEYAAFGISSIETAFCSAWTALRNNIALETLVSKFTNGPARILGHKVPEIKTGEVAELTVFSPDGFTTFADTGWKSKSKNSPFINKKLQGRVIRIFNGNQTQA